VDKKINGGQTLFFTFGFFNYLIIKKKEKKLVFSKKVFQICKNQI